MVVLNSLWCSQHQLEKFHRLNLLSFLRKGYGFNLWTYNADLSVPPGVTVQDARQVLPECLAFQTEGGPRPGSYALFSDLFQLTYLAENGGWWTHLDVTCLKPLTFETPYVFAPHWAPHTTAMYLMKAPARSHAIIGARNRLRSVTPTSNWHYCMEIMHQEIRGLEQYVQSPTVLSNDRIEVGEYLVPGAKPPDTMVAYHWCGSIRQDFANAQTDSWYYKTLQAIPFS